MRIGKPDNWTGIYNFQLSIYNSQLSNGEPNCCVLAKGVS